MLILLPVLLASQGDEKVIYRNTPFERIPGPYYEYLDLMKLATGTWRIATFLHVDKLHEALKAYQLRARDLPKYCRPLIGYDCAQTIQGYYLSPKVDLANKLRSKIVLEMDELSLHVERKYPHIHETYHCPLSPTEVTIWVGIPGELLCPGI